MGRGRSGFTIVELLIVVAIIGLLAATAVPVYQRAMLRAHRAALVADMRDLHGALMQYSADQGDFPLVMDWITGAPLTTDGYYDKFDSVIEKSFYGDVRYISPVPGEYFSWVRSKNTNFPVWIMALHTSNWPLEPGVSFDGVYYYDPFTSLLVPVTERIGL